MGLLLEILMKNTVFVKYADSLFELAKEKHKCNEIYEQLCSLNKIFESNEDIKLFFCSFSISKEEKFRLLENDFSKYFDILIINFLKLLINKYRIQFLSKIEKEFRLIYNNYKNIKEVSVISAIKLKPEEKENISKLLGEKFQKVIEISEVVDPSIIGGIIVKYDEKILDASLRSKITNLKKRLAI